MKRCSKCGETKPVAFRKHPQGKGGLRSTCRNCDNAKSAAWRAANPERKRATNAAWSAANRERGRATHAAWRESNLERARAATAAWSAANREAHRAMRAAWRAANPDRVRAKNARWRARKRSAPHIDPAVNLADVIALWGADCYICGVTTDPAAHPSSRFRAELEHVVPLAKGGSHNLENLRCACAPCNRVKGAHMTPEDVRRMFT